MYTTYTPVDVIRRTWSLLAFHFYVNWMVRCTFCRMMVAFARFCLFLLWLKCSVMVQSCSRIRTHKQAQSMHFTFTNRETYANANMPSHSSFIRSIWLVGWRSICIVIMMMWNVSNVKFVLYPNLWRHRPRKFFPNLPRCWHQCALFIVFIRILYILSKHQTCTRRSRFMCTQHDLCKMKIANEALSCRCCRVDWRRM